MLADFSLHSFCKYFQSCCIIYFLKKTIITFQTVIILYFSCKYSLLLHMSLICMLGTK